MLEIKIRNLCGSPSFNPICNNFLLQFWQKLHQNIAVKLIFLKRKINILFIFPHFEAFFTAIVVKRIVISLDFGSDTETITDIIALVQFLRR